MNIDLEALKDLRSAFVSHCKTLGCEEDYIEICENKFSYIEKALKDKELQDIIVNEIKDLFVFGVIDTKVERKVNGDVNLIPNFVYRITREIDNKKKEIIRDFILKQCFPKELKALEIIKENIIVSYDESENDKPCLILGIKVNKYNTIIFYETYDKEKIDLLKEVLL